jgi:hypothetical protein
LEELIDVTGRAAIEAVLDLSAVQVAGAPNGLRRGGEEWIRTLVYGPSP